jgi:glycosyltransferase involved in cell wall biosynthesis
MQSNVQNVSAARFEQMVDYWSQAENLNWPKLAVIIPCYNYDKYIERAIQSVTSQNRDDCELVVVDDGSTDSSWEKIRHTGAKAFRVENGGVRKACLYGLERTKAPYILILDADDELLPNSLKTIISRLDPEIAKVQFALTPVSSTGDVIGPDFPTLEPPCSREDILRQVLQTGIYISPPTSGNVFRRDVCELLIDAAYEDIIDGVLLFAAPLFGEILSIPEPLGLYRIHDTNMSGKGRLPNPAILEAEMNKFVERAEHLKSISESLGQENEFYDPKDTYFYLQHNFFLDVGRGRKPSWANMPRMLARLWLREICSLKVKLAMTALLSVCMILPNNRARSVLDYRFKVGDRSALGLVKAMLYDSRSSEKTAS